MKPFDAVGITGALLIAFAFLFIAFQMVIILMVGITALLVYFRIHFYRLGKKDAHNYLGEKEKEKKKPWQK